VLQIGTPLRIEDRIAASATALARIFALASQQKDALAAQFPKREAAVGCRLPKSRQVDLWGGDTGGGWHRGGCSMRGVGAFGFPVRSAARRQWRRAGGQRCANVTFRKMRGSDNPKRLPSRLSFNHAQIAYESRYVLWMSVFSTILIINLSV
jgi:hypothetical protein